MRFLIAALAFAAILLPVQAGGEGLAGQWKVTIYEDGQYLNFWLLKLQSKDGKLVGEADNVAKVPPTTVTGVEANGDLLTLNFKLANGVTFAFEGKLPKPGGKKILGSITRGSNSTPCFLESTPAKNAFEVNLDTITRSPSDPKVFATALAVIDQAKEQKLPAGEMSELIDGVWKTAASYGPKWSSSYGVKLVDALQADFPAVAAETASKVEKSFDSTTSADAKLRLLTAMAAAYKSAGQTDEAAKALARVDALESAALQESEKSTLTFKIEPYTGTVNQPALVELFTGAQCPPCVAADIGFDGLNKAFKETDVVLLQYHLHIPDSDALTNADAEARADYYAKSLRGTPAIYFNGKPMAPGGGGRDDGGEKYAEYRDIVNKLLLKEAGGKVTVSADRKGDIITIQAAASTESKGKVKLRLALVEDWARYKGRNGLTFHHRVVRDMPGGPAGFAVNPSIEKQLTVDVNELRGRLSKYLDDYAKNESPFPDAQRPMRLRDLHVAAFLQDDDTNEVLAAVSVPVKGQ